eukprot:gene11441-13522_t
MVSNSDMLKELLSGENTVDRSSTCTLPYPERFFACSVWIGDMPEEEEPLTDEVRLTLYALFQQGLEGRNPNSRPWGPFVSYVDQAKWDAWSSLGDMAGPEAMRLYVRTVEDEYPFWWQQMSSGDDPAQVRAIKDEVEKMSDIVREVEVKFMEAKVIEKLELEASLLEVMAEEVAGEEYEEYDELKKEIETLMEKGQLGSMPFSYSKSSASREAQPVGSGHKRPLNLNAVHERDMK